MEGAVWEGAVLEGAVLEGAVLEGAVLEGAVLEGAVLGRCSLEGAVWRVQFGGCNLEGDTTRERSESQSLVQSFPEKLLLSIEELEFWSKL